MKIRAQIGMVLNLDKCIGCHTCSVTCKQVWTNRPGVEYVWFNNVESKPGIGYPHAWENQDKWQGGWTRRPDGKLVPRQGSKLGILANIFANPKLPQIDDYYEPFTFDYAHLQGAGERQSSPVARPVSVLTGERMEKINGGPNWEDDLGGHAKDRHADRNLDGLRDDGYGEFERSFLMYLPRLCEHCLNPTCVASCPEGSIYKREEDGIVLVDQNKCKGWRMCISGCPYKKIYFNWKTSKAEKCIFCYPRIESGQPTICAESCVGRMRYLGVVLYDADRIAEAAATPATSDLLAAQRGIFLDPDDPAVQAEARAQGIPESWLVAARRSPVYDLAVRWQLALPLHPEYRTLPMVWYVPPLSPIQGHLQDRRPLGADQLHEVEEGRIPVRYLANLLTAGDEAPVRAALGKLLALRRYGRTRQMGAATTAPTPSLAEAGLDAATAERMYQLLAIANYEDRFVLPTAHREYAQAAFGMESSCGFADGGGCEASASCGKAKLFGGFGAGKGGQP